ncbi:precorrin-2 dehydrogenase/sirohydrochlorin ferrochelatase family protein [Brevibacillus choshinensis]|uniref:precorrin-2 dehydrogenase n=1 Tax=Brevibacillus choshinensis TaxID=54911 RepID=A0ABX7FU68_BRECH|nr:bifunctional precorrin-2 dehydrogenase/sirohydrochlorin ferrochelatase [Brevibacillus choshinensis]QRG68827.1 bifunctional precorrin-2 dehydrogenase/sirohydrochlorin ferrochelatase [Brevibacillus choshinensis]
MRHYPMMVALHQKRCLVVGGGQVAERKIQSLLDTGADVTVIAPSCTAKLEAWSGEGLIDIARRPFEQEDVVHAVLIIAATDDPEVNLAVHAACQPHQWVNIVDRPDLCTFTVPAVVERGDMQIAISTGGNNPGLAKKLRRQLEEWFGPEYGAYTQFLGDVRQRVLRSNLAESQKRAILIELLDDRFLLWTRSGEFERRDQEAERLLHGRDATDQ